MHLGAQRLPNLSQIPLPTGSTPAKAIFLELGGVCCCFMYLNIYLLFIFNVPFLLAYN